MIFHKKDVEIESIVHFAHTNMGFMCCVYKWTVDYATGVTFTDNKNVVTVNVFYITYERINGNKVMVFKY